jgi:hypothetical protein
MDLMLTGQKVQRNLGDTAMAWVGLVGLGADVAMVRERSDRAAGLNSSTASKVW